MYPSVHCSIVYSSMEICQDGEATLMSIDRWIRMIWYIYTKEYYSALKKELNNAICSTMD